MFECPACGANIHYAPGLNVLKCPYCDTVVPVENNLKGRQAGEIKLNAEDFADIQELPWENRTDDEEEIVIAEENAFGDTEYREVYEEADMTIYTCSQCGGELLADDSTAATFCSYCGSSIPLKSRLTKVRKPRYIIPFSITKQEAIQKFWDYKKTKHFAVTDSNEIIYEKLRGIYMPYWLYTVKGEKTLRREVSKSTYLIDYDLVTYYDGRCIATAEYNNIAFDGSSSFYDEISQELMPYYHAHMKPFDLSYMSGFYADTADVEASAYDTEILRTINKDLTKEKQKQFFKDYDISGDFQSVFDFSDLDIQKRELVYVPVWFMSHRVGKRVSYAAINGDSGKVWADIPMSAAKYLGAALAIAVAFFFMLNNFVLLPEWTLSICMVLAIICMFMLNDEADRVYYHENLYDDIGYVSKMDSYHKSLVRWQMDNLDRNAGVLSNIKKLLIICAAHFLPFIISFALFMLFGGGMVAVEVLSEFGVYIFAAGMAMREFFKGILIKVEPKPSAPFKSKVKYFIKPVICLLMGMAILIIRPVEDYYYYGANVLLLVMLILSVGDLVMTYNLLTSRRLPQLNKRGGEESEIY